MVIFTESLTTQDYLRRLLLDSRLVADDDVTLFRGDNDTPRARQALERWVEEVGSKLPADSRPTPDVAVRLALVHEFRHRSRILISTEAGAKGLNLQFCDTVINYDLPWNPQRIEQRIGRCHRYGQQRDVTVINFLARDNEAQRLTFEILSQKLDLFGTVLDATDEVLHRPGSIAPESLVSALGADFETQLRRIYDRARTIDEVERELAALRDSLGSKRQEFETAQKRTADVIQRRFDANVRQVFRRIQEELPRELEEFDRHVERVVVDYLESLGVPHRLVRRDDSAAELTVEPSPLLPEALRGGTACTIGGSPAGAPLPPLHLGHPLVQAAIEEIRGATRGRRFSLRIEARSQATSALRGRRGRLRLLRVHSRGFEAAEQLVPVAVLEGDSGPLSVGPTRDLLAEPMADLPAGLSPPSGVSDATLGDAVDERLFLDGDAAASEHPRFERTLEQLERFIGDRVLILERRRAAALADLLKSEAARDAAMGADQRDRAEKALRRAQEEIERHDGEITRLRAGEDDHYQRWRRHAQERRYTPPVIEEIADVEFEIA